MRILLIGREGQLAWELQRALQPLGEVVALNQSSSPPLDLSRPGELFPILERLRPELIVNAAAYTAVDRAEEERELALRVNGEAVGALAKAAGRIGAGLIHFSTDYVFDGKKGRPYCEEDPTSPLNLYGQSKLEGERRLIASGVPFLILRTSWLYASRGRNFLLTLLRLFRQRGGARVVADQIGSPTPARLVAEATAQIVAKTGGDLSAVSGIYHLACRGETSWHGFAVEIARRAFEMGLLAQEVEVEPIPTEAYPTPALRPRYSVLDTSKLAGTFGLKLPDWRVGLELVLEELRSS